ncbi:phosphatidic acid phosphatase type 2/haloperoxidase [Melanogaster broomeanus]|nr:phosphatidic acid phosphatase type 2/haloperoxidase [Melanogaster broomeanus]
MILYYIANHVTGFKRQFSLTDTSFAVHQRVTTHVLYLVSGPGPLVAQIIVNLLTVRSWWDLHHSTLGLWLSITIAGSITQLVKVTVGRPRPGESLYFQPLQPSDVIARCLPIPGSEDPIWGLSTVDICTQTSKHILEDGWRSFPSGHSSLSFAGLGFLTFYLAGKLHLFDTRGHATKAWLALAPLAGASWVAISRTMDYRHHWQDVITGSLLGLVVSYFAYRQYYPGLASKDAHIPYTTRFEDAESSIELEAGDSLDAEGGDEEESAGLLGGRSKPNGSGSR